MRPRRPGADLQRVGIVSVLLALVMVLSVAALFFGAFAYGLSGLQEQRSQHQLYSSIRGLLSPSSPVAPWIGGVIPAGSPVALLNSPQAGLRDVVVVEGTSSGDLLAGPGHLPDTPLPGQAGAAVLLGKSTTAGAPFGQLARLRRGDVITVRTGQGRFRFTVEGRLVNGGRLPTVPSTSGFLLLGTSGGVAAQGGFTPGHVVYTYAKLQGRVAPAPHGQPHSVTRSELPGYGDPDSVAIRGALVRAAPRGVCGVLVAVVLLGPVAHVASRRTRALCRPVGLQHRGAAAPPQRLLNLPGRAKAPD